MKCNVFCHLSSLQSLGLAHYSTKLYFLVISIKTQFFFLDYSTIKKKSELQLGLSHKSQTPLRTWLLRKSELVTLVTFGLHADTSSRKVVIH